MKRRSKFNKIVCAILTLVLVAEIIAVFGVSLVKKTIGDRKFIERELERLSDKLDEVAAKKIRPQEKVIELISIKFR